MFYHLQKSRCSALKSGPPRFLYLFFKSKLPSSLHCFIHQRQRTKMPPSALQTIPFLLFSLLSSFPFSSSSAMCSDLYGHPQQQACWEMLIGPNTIPYDAGSRLFSLPLRRRPPHILTTQWRMRQRLPYLTSNGK